MKKTAIIILGVTATAMFVLVGLVTVEPRNNQPPAAKIALLLVKAAKTSEPAPVKNVVVENKGRVKSEPAIVESIARPQTSAAPNAPLGGGKPALQDPDARLALSFVGADPMAEQYWIAAINDPSLPANERKDLIEDLNEDGLSDSKPPGPQDVPLILNRMWLIESLAPLAMDSVNTDAFAEAYKDLNNLLAGLPVQ